MGRRTDLLTDVVASRSASWPVIAWKSPAVHVNAPTALKVKSIIPPHAFVDYSMECIAPGDGAWLTGSCARLQRSNTAGANEYIHPTWFADEQSMYLLSGNAANAYYMGDRVTGVITALTAARWNQRLYGAWPLRKPDLLQFKSQRRDRKFSIGDQLAVLRKRWVSPWVRGDSLIGSTWHYWYLQNVAHGDEPAFLQLWGRPIIPEAGFQVGQEVLCRGVDNGSGGGAGEVSYMGRDQVSAYPAGQCVLSFSAATSWASCLSLANPSAIVNLTRNKWEFQLRAAFAGDADDDLVSREYRARSNHLVQFWTSDWTPVPYTAIGNGNLEFMLPENFIPIDIMASIRTKVGAVATTLWKAGDQQYSTNAGYAGYAGLGCTIVRQGRKLIVPNNAWTVNLFRSGAGAGNFYAGIPGIHEIQLRAIG